MNDKVKIWNIIGVSLVLCTLIISCMVIIVSKNPFEFSFVADDNAVKITDNLMKTSERASQFEIDYYICETKLELLDNDVCVSNNYRTEVYEERHDFVNDNYDCAYGYNEPIFNCKIKVADWGDSYTYIIEREYTK